VSLPGCGPAAGASAGPDRSGRGERGDGQDAQQPQDEQQCAHLAPGYGLCGMQWQYWQWLLTALLYLLYSTLHYSTQLNVDTKQDGAPVALCSSRTAAPRQARELLMNDDLMQK
jgi:hypothetical protein